MLKFFLQNKKTKTYRAQHSYKMIFKPQVFESIMQLKGWGNNAKCAEEMLFTRQYVSMVRRGVCSVSTDFVLRLLELTGNINSDTWSGWFRVVPTGEFNANHQYFNALKNQGKMPYAVYSDLGSFRAKDAVVEFQKKYFDK